MRQPGSFGLHTLAAGLMLLVAAACAPERHREPRVALLCPSGMAGLLAPLTEAWTERSGMKVQLAEDSPERITRQVNGGAPGDLYISAEPRWLTDLITDGHVNPSETWPLFDDPLVIVTRAQPERPVRHPIDLARPNPLRVALPEGGWTGRVGRAALSEAGLWSGVREHLSQPADGPSAIAALVSGRTEAAILRRSEAVGATTTLTITDWPHSPTTRARVDLALLRTAPHRAEALELARYLTESPEAQAALQAAGLGLSAPPRPDFSPG